MRITSALLASTLSSLVQAIDNYAQCLACFHQNFYDGHYYCDDPVGGACRGPNDARCDFNNMITDYSQCVRGFENCYSKKFTVNDFNSTTGYETTLVPGYGCYINLDRTFNGTWGELHIKADNNDAKNNLLVFDSDIPEI